MTAVETTVSEQVAAYNAHDLERFLATYAPDVELVGPDGGVRHGHEALRAGYDGLIDRVQMLA